MANQAWEDLLEEGNGKSSVINLDPFANPKIEATLPSGEIFLVSTEAEREALQRRANLILEQHKLTNPLDLMDLDTILKMDLLANRYSDMLHGNVSEELSNSDMGALQRNLTSVIETRLKVAKALGIDRATRESGKSEDLATYINELLDRAEEFGVRRNEEHEASINYMNEVFAKATLWRNANEEERDMIDANASNILDFILDDLLPKWKEIDAKFQQSQKMWISDQ